MEFSSITTKKRNLFRYGIWNAETLNVFDKLHRRTDLKYDLHVVFNGILFDDMIMNDKIVSDFVGGNEALSWNSGFISTVHDLVDLISLEESEVQLLWIIFDWISQSRVGELWSLIHISMIKQFENISTEIGVERVEITLRIQEQLDFCQLEVIEFTWILILFLAICLKAQYDISWFFQLQHGMYSPTLLH